MNRTPRPLALLLVLSWIVALAGRAVASQQWTIVDPLQSPVTLSSGTTGAAQLSGLTWVAGNQFYAVSDDIPRVFPLTITVDNVSGAISAASLSNPIMLAAGSDAEGIAYDAVQGGVYVSDEVGPAIREFSLVNGSVLQTIAVPAVFSNQRTNLSLESLSLEAGGQALWTANEEALSVDGPVSSFTTGTVVRLQKFDAALQPVGQWAYVTDPIAGDILNPGRDVEVSGVSDLIALPGGQLLVLERELGTGFFRNRIYEVDFGGATEVSAVGSLTGATYTAVTKFLLWEGFLGANFEGAALGPTLADGSRSVLLISDNGGGLSQKLKALILAPPAPPTETASVTPTPTETTTPTPTATPVCASTPLAGCQTPGRSTFALTHLDGRRDRLSWVWGRGTVPTTAPFGNPTGSPATAYTLCVYDTAGGVQQLSMSLAIAGGTSWKAVRTSGFRLRDRAGTNDGVTGVRLGAGTGRAFIQVRGAGSRLPMPLRAPGALLLNLDPSVTVQFVNRDDPSQCFTAVYGTATRATAQRFRARF